jgi:hypothetical protein
MKKENLLSDEEKKRRLKESRRKWRLNNKEQVKQKLKEKNMTVIKVRKVREDKLDDDTKKEHMKESQKRWRENNKEKVKEIAHKAYIKRIENDPTFRARENEQKKKYYETKKIEKEFIKLDEIITKYF